jgi:hypothetical protein
MASSCGTCELFLIGRVLGHEGWIPFQQYSNQMVGFFVENRCPVVVIFDTYIQYNFFHFIS